MAPAPTIETLRVETAPGLVFDVSTAGNGDAPLVLMLHGFCVSRYFWDNQMPALAEAGYFAVAPNQRGYAADARPDPRDFDNYRVDRLIGDALDIVAAVGHGKRRFHLVGHDWGGSLSWIIADRWPERIASLTMLSRPHPASFARAMKEDPEQPHRSRHHHELLDPGAEKRLLAENGKWVRDRLVRNGVPEGGDPQASVGDRHPGSDGGGPRLVSSARRAPTGRPDEGAHIVHLGRHRRHRRPGGGRGHRRVHRRRLPIRCPPRRRPLRRRPSPGASH